MDQKIWQQLKIQLFHQYLPFLLETVGNDLLKDIITKERYERIISFQDMMSEDEFNNIKQMIKRLSKDNVFVSQVCDGFDVLWEEKHYIVMSSTLYKATNNQSYDLSDFRNAEYTLRMIEIRLEQLYCWKYLKMESMKQSTIVDHLMDAYKCFREHINAVIGLSPIRHIHYVNDTFKDVINELKHLFPLYDHSFLLETKEGKKLMYFLSHPVMIDSFEEAASQIQSIYIMLEYCFMFIGGRIHE